jgi:hypothetical protein
MRTGWNDPCVPKVGNAYAMYLTRNTADTPNGNLPFYRLIGRLAGIDPYS